MSIGVASLIESAWIAAACTIAAGVVARGLPFTGLELGSSVADGRPRRRHRAALIVGRRCDRRGRVCMVEQIFRGFYCAQYYPAVVW
jgi:hypothetical protein